MDFVFCVDNQCELVGNAVLRTNVERDACACRKSNPNILVVQPHNPDSSQTSREVRKVPIAAIPMLFNRPASLRGPGPARDDLCEEPAARLAGKLLKGNCGRSSAADEAK